MKHGSVEDEMRSGNGGSKHRVSSMAELRVKAEARRVDLPRNVPLREDRVRYDFTGY